MRKFSLADLNAHAGFDISASWLLVTDACRSRWLGPEKVGQPVVTRAGATLAKWIVNQADRLTILSDDDPLADGDMIERIIAGAVGPEPELVEAICERTLGTVLPSMFLVVAPDYGDAARFRFRGDHPPATEIEGPGEQRFLIHAPRAEISDGIAAHYCHGSIGREAPSGMLFHVVADRRHGGAFVVTGLGLAVRLDLSTAIALRDAIDEGIAYERGRIAGAAGAAGKAA